LSATKLTSVIPGRPSIRFRCSFTHLFVLLSLFLLLSVGSPTQTVSSPRQATADDVVMLALQPLTPRAELQRHLTEGLVGDSNSTLNVEKHLLEIQMNIVRETAQFGPILLIVPDETTESVVHQRCQEFQICELLSNDHVRIKVVPHDGVWIRDFGPQIEAAGDSAYVAHWRYFDVRLEQAKQEKTQQLETARLRLLEARQQEDHSDAFTQGSTPEARKAVASTIDDRLYLLREYSEILNEASPQRTGDENSAYDIADAVLAAPDFHYKSSSLALDGGNLLKLEDGRCLTTRVLLSRNKDQNIDVDQELQKIAGCKEITYLDALPGGVIEHVDMFLLPAGGNRILLASYDLSQPFASEYWGKLTSAERNLAVNAEITMKLNAERLMRLGYEVIPVSSPFPVIPANGHTYYPSALNALVRTNAGGRKQILVPSYKDYETDIQASALKQIAAAFGPNAAIVTIEATEAAKSQGAIHCLTLTAPLQLSIFGDSADSAVRTAAMAQKAQLDRKAAAEIAVQIPALGLAGSWVILDNGQTSDASPLELYPQRIFFNEHEFQKGVFGQVESRGKYIIYRKDSSSWSVRFLFQDQNVANAVIQWLRNDEVKLLFADSDSTLLLRRVSSSQVSPFSSQEHSLSHAGDRAHDSNEKSPKQNKPSSSTANGSVHLEPVEP
jgi:agmatine/peptidylarginine deiminase